MLNVMKQFQKLPSRLYTSRLFTLGFRAMAALTLILALTALPAFAQEGGAGGNADTPSLNAGIPAIGPSATAPAVPTVNAPTTAQDLAAWSADPGNIELAAKLLLNGVVNGQWGFVISLLLTVLLAMLRRFIPEHTVVGKWLATRVGIIVANLLVSLGLGFTTTFAAGGEVNVAFFVKVISISVTAAGAWGLWSAISTEVSERKAKAAGEAAAGDPKSTLDK